MWDVGEYLHFENCKCRIKIVNKLVAETVEEVKIAKITLTENENKYKWNSCTLMIVVFTICTRIGIYFVYYN